MEDGGNFFWMLLSFGMGLVAFIASNVVRRLFEGAKVPTDMARWNIEVEQACFDLIRARLHVASMERRLMDYVGEVPPDFNAALFSAPMMAKTVEEAAVAQSRAKGDFPEERFDNVTPLAEGEQADHTWIAGQLLRRVS